MTTDTSTLLTSEYGDYAREFADRCRRFDSRLDVSGCQMFPGKCRPLSFFMDGRESSR
jgi:hypothetical protein